MVVLIMFEMDLWNTIISVDVIICCKATASVVGKMSE